MAPLAFALAVLLLCSASAASAQAPRQRPGPQRDFLLEVPKWSLTAQLGWHQANTSSDVYELITDQLTVDKGDFSGPTLGLTLARHLTPHINLLAAVQTDQVSIDSEFRDYVDQNRLPIEQTTRLSQVPLTVGIAFSPTGWGSAVGSYTWIPRKVAFYVGATAGAVFYELEQEGSFVDFTDFTVFDDRFSSSGVAPTVHAFAGFDVKLTSKYFLNLEASYAWAEADLDRDFVGFNPIDLSGLRATTGFKVVF